MCGTVRYESMEPPDNGGYCHCTVCQKGSGGLHTVMIVVPESGFRFTKGEPKYYYSSELLRRGFCTNCGSTMVGIYEGDPHVVVSMGGLDHPEDWPVDQEGWWGHVYVADKVPWEIIADGLPQVVQNRSGGNVDAVREWRGKAV